MGALVLLERLLPVVVILLARFIDMVVEVFLAMVSLVGLLAGWMLVLVVLGVWVLGVGVWVGVLGFLVQWLVVFMLGVGGLSFPLTWWLDLKVGTDSVVLGMAVTEVNHTTLIGSFI